MNYTEFVRTHSTDLVTNLVNWAVQADQIDIHHDYHDTDEWAALTMHLYEDDQEVTIRLYSGNRYMLHFGYYDEKDDFIELEQPLSSTELTLLPEALQKLMEHVHAREEGMRVPGSLLLKKK